jgi:choline dehydrogenase
MSMAPSQLGAFAKSDASQATPNLQYHVQPLSLEKFGDPLHVPRIYGQRLQPAPDFARPCAHRFGDSYAPPKITPNYLSTPKTARWRPLRWR